MSGDSLALLLFLVGTTVGAVLTAINAVEGWRRNVSILIAALFGVATLLFLFGAPSVPAEQLWKLATAITPFLAVCLVLLLRVNNRSAEQITPTRPSGVVVIPKSNADDHEPKRYPAPNPEITPEVINELVKGRTQLERENILSRYDGDRVKIIGEVSEVRPGYKEVGVYLLNLLPVNWMQYESVSITSTFDNSHKDALANVRRGDWIEITGKVVPSGSSDPTWRLIDCVFVGTASPQPRRYYLPPKPPKRRASPSAKASPPTKSE